MSDTDTETIRTPVINSILCYISSARHSIRHDDIIRTCLAFYSNDDILAGKDLLYATVNEKLKRRRGDDRFIHEMEDILDLFKKCDDEGKALPQFVTDSHTGLPPTSGFEVVARHVITLIGEISALKKEVEQLKDSRLDANIHLQDQRIMQEDILTIKGEMRKLNHKLIGEDIRRSSLILSSAKRGRSDLDFQESYCGNVHGGKDPPPDMPDEPLHAFSPNAPPPSQDQWTNRLLFDEGGPPSAPSFPDSFDRGAASDMSKLLGDQGTLLSSYDSCQANQPL